MNTAEVVPSKTTGTDPAFTSGHAVLVDHRLAFRRKQADNDFGSALRLAPRADTAPSPVRPGGGAPCPQYPLPIKVKPGCRLQFAGGYVRSLPTDRDSLHFALCCEPLQDGVNRSQYVPILLNGKSNIREVFADFHRCPRRSVATQDESTGIRKFKPSGTFAFLAHQIAKRSDRFRKFDQAFVNSLSFAKQLVKFFLRTSECLSVVPFSHAGIRRYV